VKIDKKYLVGAGVILIIAVFFLRRLFRNHRLGKAEYPPSSSLLPPMDDMDTLLPPGIARSMSQRSKVSALTNRSDDHDWHADEKGSAGEIGVARSGSTGGWGDGRGYRGVGDDVVSPLSPLPPVARRDGVGDVFVDGVGFSLVPKSKRVELSSETEMKKEKIFELSV
jgi:hypothetical protein